MFEAVLTRKQVMSALNFKSIKPLIRLEEEGKLHRIKNLGRSVRYSAEEVGGLLHQKNSEKYWNNYKECCRLNEISGTIIFETIEKDKQ